MAMQYAVAISQSNDFFELNMKEVKGKTKTEKYKAKLSLFHVSHIIVIHVLYVIIQKQGFKTHHKR